MSERPLKAPTGMTYKQRIEWLNKAQPHPCSGCEWSVLPGSELIAWIDDECAYYAPGAIGRITWD